jgi:DNA-binding transcriptional MerR regulator
MNPDIERLLNLRNPPQRLTAAEAAGRLGLSPHEIRILVARGLLKPLGHPAPNGPKYFLTALLDDLKRDEKWHGRATDALQEYWRHKNARKQDSTDKRQSTHLQTQEADLDD